MTTCSGRDLRNHAIASTILLICASLISMPTSRLHAEDPADKAGNLLDNLKKRSAEERWQRMKKQYSVDPSAPRRTGPALTNEGPLQGLTEDQMPPSPDEAKLIPRLAAFPLDTSNDWIKPAREPAALLDALESEAPLRTAQQNVAAPTPQPAGTEAAAPVTAAPDDGAKKGPAGDVITGESRPPSERKITDIAPFYDRDRDSDIRNFAMTKGREFGLQYKHRVYVNREFPDVLLPWEASQQFHHPLYFSDPALERYGHVHHPLIQPVASIARFGTQFIMLPYQMTIDPPFSEEYPLGWYRPGDCAPKLTYQIPLNAEAALVEASAIAGLYFLIVP